MIRRRLPGAAEARGRPDVESFYDLAEDEQEAILEKLTTELMDAVVAGTARGAADDRALLALRRRQGTSDSGPATETLDKMG